MDRKENEWSNWYARSRNYKSDSQSKMQKGKRKRPIKEKEMVSTDQRYQLAGVVLLEGFQHTLNR